MLWSVFGKLCSAVHRVLNSKNNKCNGSVVVKGACVASCRVAGLNLGGRHFKCYVIF